MNLWMVQNEWTPDVDNSMNTHALLGFIKIILYWNYKLHALDVAVLL